MKYLIITSIAIISLFFIFGKNDNVFGGRCSPNGTCYACKNCSGCKNCAINGGECSVCRKPKRNATTTKPKGNTTIKNQSIKNTSSSKNNNQKTNDNSIQSKPTTYSNPSIINTLPSNSNIPKKDEIFMAVDQMPEFIGGEVAMQQFIEKNKRNPSKVKEQGIKGKCNMILTINKQGEVSDVQIIKKVTDCEECDKEAIRVVKLMPKWKNGNHGGNPVNVYYRLSIDFN